MCSFSKKTLIIIPSHNEEKSLPGVIKAIRTFASDVDVLVVNDASADGTSCVARAAGAIVLDLAHNLGIGGAMQTGFRYARYKGYELALQIDGDGQHPAKFVNDLRKDVIDSNVDLVVGSRFMKDAGFKGFFFQRIGIRYFSVLIKMLTGINVLDVTSGFRAFSKRAITVFSEYYPHDYPEVESFVVLKKLGLKVLEKPVTMKRRKHGESTINWLDAVYYMIRVSLGAIVSSLRNYNKLKGV